ncbi:hypothetical protein SAMN04488026_100430 [Aliiruegeria lutimaris]|uniref:Uncharacterized protein n=1 Tax=Aliiruegeria lutimaris TaxID=571298 RepID=A0A1G8LES7_9RHOB|nr:hypothetical protein SAMN04488026_100430 [Aliiruegeria lutimaris]
MKNDGQLLIRIPVSDRERFVKLCEDLDTSAAREIRRFIKQFLDSNEKPEEGESR